MGRHPFIISFLAALGMFFHVSETRAQADCNKVLIDAENLYQSGQLYDISDKLKQCLESGFNYQQKQSAYRLLTLTYLNINQEEKAKNTLHSLLKLNPDYVITKEKDPVELYNLYRQFNVNPVFYLGLSVGTNGSLPFILHQRSSSSLAEHPDKFYQPYYGFALGGDLAMPLYKNILLEFSPGFVQTSYSFQSHYLTDGFADALLPQVQEVRGKEVNQQIYLPLSLNFRVPSRTSGLFYHLAIGAGASFLLQSAYQDVNRQNRQIFTEEINVQRVETTPFRRRANLTTQLELGLEYKFAGYFWGARTGIRSTLFNHTLYSSQQELFFNTMSTTFGWLEDDFVLMSGHFSVFVRKPIYKFL